MVEPTEGHTIRRYDGELGHLHFSLLEMGGLVLAQVREALAAFKNRDMETARKVVAWDRQVDQSEVRADAEIVGLLARRCPVGRDLRTVMAISKGVSDLERIGDEAVRIAGLVLQLFGPDANAPANHLSRDVIKIGTMAADSVRTALEVFEGWNDEKAREVIEAHREMEDEFQAGLRRLMTFVLEDSRNIGAVIGVVSVLKSLERIGHHAQNLAEYVIFEVRGEDVRAVETGGPDSTGPKV